MTTDLFPGRSVPFLSLLVAFGLVLASALPAAAVTPEEDPDAAAAGWLVEQYDDHPGSFGLAGNAGDVADLIFALAGAGVAGERAGDLLADLDAKAPSYVSGGSGPLAKTLLAVLVSGGDPATFAGTDLEADLRAAMDGTTGAFDPSAFNQALAVLALAATGNGVPPEAIAYLQSLDCGDGGYAFDCSFGADIDTTSLVAQAYLATGTDASAPVQWIADQQMGDGSFHAFGSPSPNSTGVAAMTLRAAGQVDAADAAAGWLASVQAACGGEDAGSFGDPAKVFSLEFATVQGLLAFAAPRYDQLDLTAADGGVPVVCAQEVADPVTDTAGDDTLATGDDELADTGASGLGLALLAAVLVAGGLALVRVREDT